MWKLFLISFIIFDNFENKLLDIINCQIMYKLRRLKLWNTKKYIFSTLSLKELQASALAINIPYFNISWVFQ